MAKRGSHPRATKAAAFAPDATLDPPPPMAVQVARLTSDPGYRAVGTLVDNWEANCDCLGGGLPAAAVNEMKASLIPLSLDPALALLAPVIATLMGNCCTASVTPVKATMANAIGLLTLDPGAVRVAMVLDAMKASCCDIEVD